MRIFVEHDDKSRGTKIAAHTVPRVHPSAREIPAHPLFEERLPRSVGKPVGPFNLSGAGVDQSRFDSGLCLSADKRIVETTFGARARRPEERRVGKEFVSTWSYRWLPYTQKHNHRNSTFATRSH